jgi:hypothetical protein
MYLYATALSREYYEFQFQADHRHDGIRLVEYAKQTRQTTRHAWRSSEYWAANNRSDNMESAPKSIPPAVIEQARKEIATRLTSCAVYVGYFRPEYKL